VRSRRSSKRERAQRVVAIDFETATAARDSACAVGVAVFEGGEPVDAWGHLIQPPGNRYDGTNIAIHGIMPEATSDAPSFPEVWPRVAGIVSGALVVAHNTAFDMSVLRHSAEHHGYSPPWFRFACSYRLARSAFPDEEEWSLPAMAWKFDIPLRHHDPVSDAMAAGSLWFALPRHLGTNVAELLGAHGYNFGRYGGESYERSSNALVSGSDRFSAKDVKPRGEPNPDGLLFGKRLVFTGTLASMSRAGAFQAAVDAGAKPLTSVSGRTDYLVLGVGAGYRKPDTPQSTKHPKALALAADGASVQIIDEDQFVCLLAGVATT